MKGLTAAIILTITLTLMFTARCEALSSSGGLRQSLVDHSGVEAVYVVDRTHTFVRGTLPPADEFKAFKVVGRYYSGPGSRHVATMIEHEAEPFVYKSPSSLRDLEPIRGGEVRLTAEPLGPGTSGYSAIDIFETVTLSCQGRGGYPLYVVPRKYNGFKRLTEVSALEAFEYILAKHKSGAWFAACDGAPGARFQVMKNYDFINDGVELAELREGLVLGDVDYVKDKGAETSRLAVLENSWPRSPKSLEMTAREIARIKVGYVQKFDGKRHYGTYKGDIERGRCASVSIKSVADDMDIRVSEVHDYKVCRGKVYALGTGEIREETPRNRGKYIRGGGLKLAKRP
ncbi:MAG: hypothetical protein ACE5EZ_02355 [Thermodesulfobacteriota bacterium]